MFCATTPRNISFPGFNCRFISEYLTFVAIYYHLYDFYDIFRTTRGGRVGPYVSTLKNILVYVFGPYRTLDKICIGKIAGNTGSVP